MLDTYFETIRTSFTYFPVIAAVFTVPYALFNYHKYGSVFSLRILIVYSFILYMMTMCFLVCWPLPSRAEVLAMHRTRGNFIPFNNIVSIFRNVHLSLSNPSTWLNLIHNASFQEMSANIIMFMPLGMYLHYYFGKSLKQSMLISFCVSLFFEVSQLTGLFFLYPRNYRLFDVNDLINNTLGGCCGWILFTPFKKLLPSRTRLDKRSYERGESVSLARRMAASFCDLILLFAISSLISRHQLHLAESFYWQDFFLFTSYYFFWTLLFHRTPGMMLTSLKIQSFKPDGFYPFQIFIRYLSCFGWLFLGPWLIAEGLSKMTSFAPLLASGSLLYWIRVILVIGWVIIGCFTVAFQLGHRRTFFASLSGTVLVSSIRVPDLNPTQKS